MNQNYHLSKKWGRQCNYYAPAIKNCNKEKPFNRGTNFWSFREERCPSLVLSKSCRFQRSEVEDGVDGTTLSELRQLKFLEAEKPDFK